MTRTVAGPMATRRRDVVALAAVAALVPALAAHAVVERRRTVDR